VGKDGRKISELELVYSSGRESYNLPDLLNSLSANQGINQNSPTAKTIRIDVAIITFTVDILLPYVPQTIYRSITGVAHIGYCHWKQSFFSSKVSPLQSH